MHVLGKAQPVLSLLHCNLLCMLTPCTPSGFTRSLYCSFILIEFWQLNRTLNSSNATAAAAAADAVVPDADSADVRVLAARGTQPWVTVSPDGHMKVTPPIRDADTGLTPVGTFQDDAAVVYSRATARVFFPTSSPMTDVGEPLDPDTW